MYRRRVAIDDARTEPAPPTRRSLRAPTGETGVVASGETGVATTAAATDAAPAAAVSSTARDALTQPPARTALAWVDERAVARGTYAASGMIVSGAAEPAAIDLLEGRRLPSAVRPATVLPVALVLLVVAVYAVAALLWPLHAVTPELGPVQVQPAAAAPAAPEWPGSGSAAVAVQGIGAPVASTSEAAPMASITKLVTALLVLEELPLKLGEQGPDYAFTFRDRSEYYGYLADGQSALNVPVGGTLSEYQMLQGMLIGSANNYADRLAAGLWPTDAVFAAAAQRYLTRHGLTGIRVVDPSGFDPGNTADPAALAPLAERALANPVIAEIVATPSVKLPGAGTVENTNALLADPGVVGLKTGTLDKYTLLAAKDITVGDAPVRLFAAVLDQPNAKTRFAATRDLFAQLESEVQLVPAVTAGTTAGRVTTAWGESVDVVVAADASVVLWNGSTPAATITLDLGDRAEKGDVVGTLTVTGPLDSETVDLLLADDVEGPSPWWRLTHPVELFGLGG